MLKNYFMTSKILSGILVLLTMVGCQSVRNIHVATTGSGLVTLRPEDAQKLYAHGRELFSTQPRTLARVTQAAQLLTDAAQILCLDYNAQWAAAEAWVFVADSETNSSTRITAAKQGIVFARQARELQPDRVEGHYWYALAVGLLADANRAYGLKAVGEMEPALRRAIELDERYDYGGPVRVFGILF